MKSIDYCLDKVLSELKNNFNDPNRPSLKSELLLQDFEMPIERHEFFKSILNKLIDDGYADFLDDIKDRKAAALDTYQGRTIITAMGYYFVDVEGGYSKKTKDLKIKTRRSSRNELFLIVGTFLAGIGSIALTIWEMWKYYHSHCN